MKSHSYRIKEKPICKACGQTKMDHGFLELKDENLCGACFWASYKVMGETLAAQVRVR